MKVKSWMLALLTVLCLACFAGAVACSREPSMRIDTPETAFAESGLYTSPEYQVVDTDGNPVEGMTVRLKSVVDPDGEKVIVTPDGKKFTANKEGVYTLVYTANNGDVKESTVRLTVTQKVEPPTILIDEAAEIPDAYIKGFTYYVPYFTYSSEADFTKSWMKIWHEAADETRTEIVPDNNQFTAGYESGSYEIIIHAENSAGVFREYKYSVRAAAGPQEIVEGKIGYFDETFGVEQVYRYNVEMKFTTEKKYGNEKGCTEVTFKSSNTGLYAEFHTLAQKDISEYDYLVYRVFNPNDFEIFVVFHVWFGLQTCAPGVWTEVKVPVEAILDRDEDPTYQGSLQIHSLEDITGLTFMAYNNYKPLENGDKIYLSALYAVKDLDAPEEIIPGKIGYFDEKFGEAQFEVVNSKIEFTTEKAYGEEAGSLKVTVLPGYVNTFGKLVKLTETDVSAYDSLVLRVFNPNTFKIWFSVEETEPNMDVSLTPNEWTEVRIPISRLVDSSKLAGFDFRVAQENWASLQPNTAIYLSVMYAEKSQNMGPSEVVPGKLCYFDEQYGVAQFAADHVAIEFSSDTKHGDEAGSLKLTVQTGNNGNIGHLLNLTETDLSGYKVVKFYVYNPGTEDMWFATEGKWFSVLKEGKEENAQEVRCIAGEWTEVSINLSAITAAGKRLEEVALKANAFNWAALADDSTFYLSSVNAL